MAISSVKRKEESLPEELIAALEDAPDIVKDVSDVIAQSKKLAALYSTASPASFCGACSHMAGVLIGLTKDADLVMRFFEADDSGSAAIRIADAQLQKAWEDAWQATFAMAILSDRKRKSLRMWFPSGEEKAGEIDLWLAENFDECFDDDDDDDDDFYD